VGKSFASAFGDPGTAFALEYFSFLSYAEAMRNESFNAQDDEVKTGVNEATNEADPTTYSMLPPDEMRVKLIRPLNEYSLPVRTADGETYYELSNKNDPRGQQVVARMLKGVLNVADVVTVPDEEGKERYYSRKMPLQKIENDTSKEELASEQLLLEYLFNSKDHLFNPQSNWANNATYKDGKMVHFDFGEDADNFLRAPTNRDSLIARLQFMSPETIAHLKEKLSELHERFAGEEGKEFFRSIIAASAAPATEVFTSHDAFEKHADLDPVELLHMVLMGRIEGFKKTLDKMGRAEQ